MRLEFLFVVLALGLISKYVSFILLLVIAFVIFTFYIFKKKYIYAMCVCVLVLRLSLLYLKPIAVDLYTQRGGHVCGFASNFSEFKFIDFCLESGARVTVKIPEYKNFAFGSYYNLDLVCRPIVGEYKNYSLMRGVRDECELKNYTALDSSNFLYILLAKINMIRDYAEGKLFSSLHYPVADLAAGLLYGFRANFDPFFKFNFSTLGLTHLIAISGYNVSLFLLLVDKIFSYVNRQTRMYIYPFCLLLFIFITGIQSSVIRACLMAQIQLLALKSKRFYSALDALIVVMFLFLFINPYQIYYDIGLWLSLLSTFAIVTFSPYLITKCKKFIVSDFILEALVLTFISFVATFFISDIFFDNANVFSIIPNILVAPLVSVLMILIFQYVFFSSSFLAEFYIYLINLLVDIFILILNFSVFLNYLVLEFFF